MSANTWHTCFTATMLPQELIQSFCSKTGEKVLFFSRREWEGKERRNRHQPLFYLSADNCFPVVELLDVRAVSLHQSVVSTGGQTGTAALPKRRRTTVGQYHTVIQYIKLTEATSVWCFYHIRLFGLVGTYHIFTRLQVSGQHQWGLRCPHQLSHVFPRIHSFSDLMKKVESKLHTRTIWKWHTQMHRQISCNLISCNSCPIMISNHLKSRLSTVNSLPKMSILTSLSLTIDLLWAQIYIFIL